MLHCDNIQAKTFTNNFFFLTILLQKFHHVYLKKMANISVQQFILEKSDSQLLNKQLIEPIKNYQRIRYSCAAVNERYLVYGSSTGALYVFSRSNFGFKDTKNQNETLAHEYTIVYSEGRVTSLAFSNLNRSGIVCFGTAKGSLVLLQLLDPNHKQQNHRSDVGKHICQEKWKELYLCSSFVNQPIELIRLEENEAGDIRVFITCAGHSVYLLERLNSVSQFIFKSLPSRILQLDSRIHQIDVLGEMLLISAEERSLLLDMSNINLSQVGSRPRPRGMFGTSFFYRRLNPQQTLNCVYASRPGMRLWQVNFEGNVLVTHQFKHFNKGKSNCVLQGNNLQPIEIKDAKSIKGWNSAFFQKLYKIVYKNIEYILTYTNEPVPVLFLIDPIRPEIAFWSEQMAPIKEIHVVGSDIFLFQEMDLKLQLNHYRIQLLPKLLLSKRIRSLDNKSYFRLLCHCNFDLEELWIQQPEILTQARDRWMQLQKQLDQKAEIEEFRSLSFSITNGIQLDPHQDDEIGKELTRKNGYNFEFPYSNGKTEKEVQSSALEPSYKCDLSANGENNSESSAIGSLIESVKSKYGWSTKNGENDDVKNNESEKKIQSINGENHSIQSNSCNLITSATNVWPKVPAEKWVCRLKCDCGYPLPSSHLNMAPSLINYERQLLHHMTVDCDLGPYEKACYENSLWILYTQILLLQQKYDQYLRTCLMLNDFNLLRNPFFSAKFAKDACLQKQLFENYAKQKTTYIINNTDHAITTTTTTNTIACLQCNQIHQFEPIKWTELLEYVYSNTDAQRFIELLLKHEHLMIEQIPDKLLLRLTKSEILKKYESSLTNFKLNRLKDHLVKNSFQMNSLHSKNCHHWCKRINLQVAKCTICGQKFGVGNEMLVIFKCEHLFHKHCLIEQKQSVKQCYKCKANG